MGFPTSITGSERNPQKMINVNCVVYTLYIIFCIILRFQQNAKLEVHTCTCTYNLFSFLSSTAHNLSQDQPSSVLTSNLGSTSSTRMTASSPVAAVIHSVGSAGSSIPTSTIMFKQPRRVKSPSPVAAVIHSVGSAGSSIPTSTIMFKQPRRVKSPSPLKAYKISPSRRVKSTENLSVRDREEAVASHPVPIKKIASPGKFARAKKLNCLEFVETVKTLCNQHLSQTSVWSPQALSM